MTPDTNAFVFGDCWGFAGTTPRVAVRSPSRPAGVNFFIGGFRARGSHWGATQAGGHSAIVWFGRLTVSKPGDPELARQLNIRSSSQIAKLAESASALQHHGTQSVVSHGLGEKLTEPRTRITLGPRWSCVFLVSARREDIAV